MNKHKENNDMKELTRKMRNLTIKACYFCEEPGMSFSSPLHCKSTMDFWHTSCKIRYRKARTYEKCFNDYIFNSRKNQYKSHINNSSNFMNREKLNGSQYNNNKGKNNKQYFHICEVREYTTKDCSYNMKKKMNPKGRQKKLQDNVKRLSKEVFRSSISNYDYNFNFVNGRALTEKQEEMNINDRTKFSRNYINNIKYYDKDDKTSEWLYDTGAGKHNNFTWLNNYIHFKKKDVQMGRCVAVKENTKIDYNNKIQ
ncbi:hypothetical protein H8356DRAFT_1354327 [Neocallimastix lanati (nom. inval.)]|nr:hypothetical protein H8356DRAFT_1354327 [Neocallimastix sp. JGI-2020a]